MSFPRYERYKASGVEWLGEVPEHWQVRQLKRVVRLMTDKAECRNRPIALENVESWSGRLIEVDTEYEGLGVAFDRGDILFGKLRPYLAKVHLAETGGEAVGDFHVLRPGCELTGPYTQYQILTPEFISVINGSTFGAKMPRVGWEFMSNLPMLAPSLDEQGAIVTFLDRETAKIDTLVDEQKRLIELLKEKRQAVISHAVTKGLNPNAPMKDSGVEWLGLVPEHWDIMRLGRLFREANYEGADHLPILSVSIHTGVSERELGADEMERNVARSEDRSKYKQVAPGDLVYNMMRAWQGGFGAVTVEGMVSPAYVVARPISEFSTTLVEHILRTPSAVEEMRRRSHGVTDFRLRLYWEEFKTIQIALPPRDEQHQVTSFLKTEISKLDLLMDETETAISLLQERRSALVAAVVTGKIDVRGLIREGAEAVPERVPNAAIKDRRLEPMAS